jgi:hypothetical protein
MSTATVRSRDDRLARALTGQARREFWGLQTTVKSSGARDTPFQYPAMMVSEMQSALLAAVCQARAGTPLTYDPFVGSGATMVEAMRLGLPFAGSDINPLAVLIAKVRSGEAGQRGLDGYVDRVVKTARGLMPESAPPAEEWCRRWFREDVAVELTAIATAIRLVPRVSVRRLLWVALAEVVRLVGNFRISTPKLQMRPPSQLSRPIDAIDRFEVGARTTAKKIGSFARTQTQQGFRERGRYLPGLDLVLGDVKEVDPVRNQRAELVLTSPPYGDNGTTMPYGQASYLPLKWIDTADIGEWIEDGLLDAARTLDTRSLGGSKRLRESQVEAAAARSPSLATILAAGLSDDGRKRVSSFFADMDGAVEAILRRCVDDAHLVITLGDRTVNGEQIPTTHIVEELFVSRGTEVITRLSRPLPRQKRIALKNNFAGTIRTETVLVMRRSPA